MSTNEELVRVTRVEPFAKGFNDPATGFMAQTLGLELTLDNGDTFTLVNIPSDVAYAIYMLSSDEVPPRRQSIYTFLANHEDFKDLMRRTLKRIVIDEFDESTGLYTATVEFGDSNMSISIKMIPSHAIFLALITKKPIYVTRKLVEMEKEWRRGEGEGGEGERQG